MVHETIATRDVLDYVADRGDVYEQREAINVLYPRYGGVFGNTVEAFVPVSGVVELGGLLAGHATGRFQSGRLEEFSPQASESTLSDVRVASPITTVGYEEPATTQP